MPLRSFANFMLVIIISRYRKEFRKPQKRGALGYTLFGLCANSSLTPVSDAAELSLLNI